MAVAISNCLLTDQEILERRMQAGWSAKPSQLVEGDVVDGIAASCKVEKTLCKGPRTEFQLRHSAGDAVMYGVFLGICAGLWFSGIVLACFLWDQLFQGAAFFVGCFLCFGLVGILAVLDRLRIQTTIDQQGIRIRRIISSDYFVWSQIRQWRYLEDEGETEHRGIQLWMHGKYLMRSIPATDLNESDFDELKELFGKRLPDKEKPLSE